MATSLEDLLQEALADFEEAPQGTAPLLEPHQDTARSTVTQSSDATKQEPSATAPAAPPKHAPKGLGLGLGGSDLPGRRPRKAADSAAGIAAPESQKAAPVDPSRAQGGAGAVKSTHKLPVEAQRLADDLMGLLQEAGLGETPEPQDADALTSALAELMASTAGGPPGAGAPGLAEATMRSAPPGAGASAGVGEDDPLAQLFGRILGGMMPPGEPSGAGAGMEGGPPPEFAAMLQQMMGAPDTASGGPARPDVGAPARSGGQVGTSGAGSSGSGAAATAGTTTTGDDDDALASSRLAGLAQQTLKTVSKQAKATRGHVEGGTAGRAGGAGPGAGGGGLPFGSGTGGGLAGMLRELGGLGLPGGASEGGEGAAPAGVSVMVDYIMQHLLSKDVLYGPLKEIRDRYPPWLEAHQGQLPAEEYQRYVAQYESVQRVCAHYETSPSDFAKLMDLIQEMQTYGDPPGDIVEEMTGGAGRDIDSILAAAEGDESGPAAGPQQPALEELSSELDKCKVQ